MYYTAQCFWYFDKDRVLAELLSQPQSNKWIVHYHEHDSLLENRPEENLSEEERMAAWDEYEREKSGVYVIPPSMMWPEAAFPNSEPLMAAAVQARMNLQQSRSYYNNTRPQYATGLFPNMANSVGATSDIVQSFRGSLNEPPTRPANIRLENLVGVRTQLTQADIDSAGTMIEFIVRVVPKKSACAPICR